MLLEKIKKYHIILASGSPRRKELLELLGIKFDQFFGSESDESFPVNLINKEIAVYLARKKSEAYPHELKSDEILITADTIVVSDEKVMGKPVSLEEAKNTLRSLSGNSHFVYTGVCLRNRDKTLEFVSGTEVVFGILSNEEIDYYIRKYKPYDKAGAYGIQEWIGYVGVTEIKGSYFNVMGLPVQRLYRELEKFIESNTIVL